METMWLKEALFAGVGANAFKLGTTLTLGWFWPRVAGCSVLYRGDSMGAINFANILAVANADDGHIQPPSYVPHNNGSTYFYVIRRANNFGVQEHTLAAAVKVSIDPNGNLLQPQPNNIFGAKAKQTDGNKMQLVWFYCSVEQKSEPACFKVYYDGGTGQVDYENPVVTICYAGRRFYSYQSDTLDIGRYLFAIRVEDTNGTENSSSKQFKIQLDAASPDPIDIISVGAI